MPNRILIVEDSHALNDLMCDVLRKAGHEVVGLLDAESVIEHPSLKDTQVMVLDIQLPGESGIQLAKRLRPLMPNLGILMLTARSTHANRLEGYEAGADYYLPKPVSPEELVAAVDSLLRRKQRSLLVTSDTPQRYIVSRSALTLSYGERFIKLSSSDSAVLVALAGATDKQLEHWQLMELLGASQGPVSRSTLDVRIYRLRSKLSEFTGQAHPIASVRSVGYRLGFEIEVV
jgi:DNA-binding response OmpR family regulator